MSGVYIKGMEMPTSCDDCEFCKRDIIGYDWCCVPMMNGRNKPLDEPVIKPDWCPLVPIPPHGRLIEESALLKGCGYIIADGMACIPVKHIANAPTIIEEER